jgi:hypothetical protein
MLVVAAIALSACASDPVVVTRWSKPGGTEASFIEVRDACLKNERIESAAYFLSGERSPGGAHVFGELAGDIAADFGGRDPAVIVDGDMFHRCMNGHGWSVDLKGFAPPEGDEVAMGY